MAFASGDRPSVTQALLGLAFYEPDWRWVQGHCLRLSDHPDPQIRAVAVLCLEYLARRPSGLDLDEVFPVLRRLSADESPWVRSNVEGALAQIAEGIYGLKSHYIRERDQLEYVLPMDREDAEAALEAEDASRVRAGLHALIQYDRDWPAVQAHCLRLVDHPDASVRKDAVECFDWLVSIHGTLDTRLVLPVLERLTEDPEVAEEARVTLKSIAQALGGHGKHET